jgi:modulator of FtsH protease
MVELKEWESFFVAQAGAAAALTGLIFVAVSINLSKILEYPHLPGRAGESLMFFVQILFLAVVGLVPHVAPWIFSGAVTVIGAGGAVVALRGIAAHFGATGDQKWTVQLSWILPRALLSLAATLPLLAAGVLALAGSDWAMPVLVAGVLASYGAGILNAWILLVEILR